MWVCKDVYLYIYTYTHTDRYTRKIRGVWIAFREMTVIQSTFWNVSVPSLSHRQWREDGGQWATPNLITRMCQTQHRDGSYQHSPGSLSSSALWRLLYLHNIIHWSKHILSVIQVNQIYLPWHQIMEKMALKCLSASTQCNGKAKLLLKNSLCCKNCANCYIQNSEVSCILMSILNDLIK